MPSAADEPVPLVAFDDQCALRSRALETLSVHGIPAEVSCEAAHLAGVRAGLGIGLMATLGQSPDGLVARDDLPTPAPIALSVWPKRGLPLDLTEGVADSLRGRERTAGFRFLVRGRAGQVTEAVDVVLAGAGVEGVEVRR